MRKTKNTEKETMNEKEIFYKEKEECETPFTHIVGESPEPELAEIDELYGAADVLSISNSEKHRKILLALSVSGMLLTLAFLLYDEAELYGLILACGVMILFLFFIRRLSDRLDCHRKYLEYRVLAESLRVQYFLSMAGVAKPVAELLPWPVKKGLPWIRQILEEIHVPGIGEKHSVLDCWIRDQKAYHQKALRRSEAKSSRDGHIARVVVLITIVSYIAALLFELLVYRNMDVAANADTVRAILKILLGTMSAITLFTGSYYGKMSLADDIDDHARMIALYELAEEEIAQDGETEELLLSLAREFLNENSTWYAYQSKNKADIVI